MGISGGPDIIQDGLVLALDAADKNSYPGSGTTWRDMSGNNITGSLINSPTFNISNGGSFGFVADDFVIMEENSALNTQTPSVEVWFKTNATNQSGFWFEKGTVNSQYSLFQEGTNIVWRQSDRSQYTNTATYVTTANWAQAVGTYTSGDRKTYINSVLVTSDAQTGAVGITTSGMSIGVYGGFNGSRGYFYNGNIAIVRVYNRVLSASEVAQNYNATKTRFGL
jgi:hypothetical protein